MHTLSQESAIAIIGNRFLYSSGLKTLMILILQRASIVQQERIKGFPFVLLFSNIDRFLQLIHSFIDSFIYWLVGWVSVELLN